MESYEFDYGSIVFVKEVFGSISTLLDMVCVCRARSVCVDVYLLILNCMMYFNKG